MSGKKLPKLTKEQLSQLTKPFFLLLVLVMVCGFLAHCLTGSETLAEYAQNNPELAYGTNDTDTENDTEMNDAGGETGTDSEILDDTASISIGNAGNPARKTELVNGKTDAYTSNIDQNNPIQEDDETMNDTTTRTTYQPGFYYEPLSEDIKKRITGISYPVAESKAEGTAVPALNLIADDVSPAVSYDDLRYVSVLHYNFNGIEQEGELICNKAIAQDMVEIFYELYQNEYQIEQIRLVDEYSGDDTLSMQDNNTSCFNYRVVDGTDSLSKHAYGLAIDINPFFNPYIVFGKGENGGDYISPAGSESYADRSKNFAYKIDENDLCYRLFKEHGFTWGGDWNSCKDYQHFQKTIG
jgi:hypothetical protein